ncbi:MAG: IS3 family transposase, partial [Thermoguttaceae bacterium]
PKKIECLGCREGTAREKAKVIWELRHEHKLWLLLEVAELPRSTYYYHIRKENEPNKHSELQESIRAIVMEHKGRYGYRRVTLELRNRGFCRNHKLVMKLMRQIKFG